MGIEGKIALITGASSGIGESIALALGRKGARLTLVARREGRLRELAARIEAEGGPAPFVQSADLRQESGILHLFEASTEHWGGLDILVNNAGLGRFASWHEGETEDWREMLDVNILAVTIATREALSRFPESGGHILSISSMAGHRVPPSGGFYAATKHFIRGFSESLRMELRQRGSPSRVSMISPGFVTTAFHEVYYKGDEEMLSERSPEYRVLDAQDIAETALYILEAPAHVAVHDVLMRSSEQPS